MLAALSHRTTGWAVQTDTAHRPSTRPATNGPGRPARASGPKAGSAFALVAPLPGRRPGQVAHPAGDIDGMVAKPLVKARHQRHFDRHRARHPAGGEFGHQAGVQLVHFVINPGQGRPGGAVPLVPAVRGPAPHVAGKLAHPLDEPAAARGQFRGEKMACREAIWHSRSWVRSSSGAIRSTVSRNRRSEATGACNKISRLTSCSISR